ncbi:MAG: sel1 repeat family protein [Gammaproteobacteria bacterium]|nr:MAG: sel1 repeat family protein [Gammaproteobacteria bacterium]
MNKGQSHACYSVSVLFVLFFYAACALAEPLKEGVKAFSNKDYGRAHELWLPLANQGNAHAQLYIGVLYRNGFGVELDQERAARWYEMAANNGLADAQYETGLMYELGKGVKQDYWTAESWYQKAIEQDFCPGELSATGGLIP